MSVIIQAFSNHILIFNNYLEGLNLIASKLNSEITDVDKSRRGDLSNNLVETTTEILYFTDYQYFGQRYDEGWGIWVETNFRLCQRLVVYKHFTQFFFHGQFPLKTHQWRKLVSKQYDYYSNYSSAEFEATLTEWNNTRKFIADITQKLGGHQIYYLNDGSTGLIIGQDLIIGSSDYETVTTELKKVIEPTSYQNLTDNAENYGDENWFIENVEMPATNIGIANSGA